MKTTTLARNGVAAEMVDLISRLADGVKICGNEKTALEQRLQRSAVLPWRDITIYPKLVFL